MQLHKCYKYCNDSLLDIGMKSDELEMPFIWTPTSFRIRGAAIWNGFGNAGTNCRSCHPSVMKPDTNEEEITIPAALSKPILGLIKKNEKS